MGPNGRVGLARESAADFAQHRDERTEVYPIRLHHCLRHGVGQHVQQFRLRLNPVHGSAEYPRVSTEREESDRAHHVDVLPPQNMRIMRNNSSSSPIVHAARTADFRLICSDFTLTCMTMDASQSTIHPIIPPPAVYDHAYTGRLAVQQGTMAQIEHYCHTMHGIVSPHQALGCAKIGEHRCFVVIPRIGGQITASIQAQIRRHEIAHCNGWPANHPR
jgi:hypothetical protein